MRGRASLGSSCSIRLLLIGLDVRNPLFTTLLSRNYRIANTFVPFFSSFYNRIDSHKLLCKGAAFSLPNESIVRAHRLSRRDRTVRGEINIVVFQNVSPFAKHFDEMSIVFVITVENVPFRCQILFQFLRKNRYHQVTQMVFLIFFLIISFQVIENIAAKEEIGGIVNIIN